MFISMRRIARNGGRDPQVLYLPTIDIQSHGFRTAATVNEETVKR